MPISDFTRHLRVPILYTPALHWFRCTQYNILVDECVCRYVPGETNEIIKPRKNNNSEQRPFAFGN